MAWNKNEKPQANICPKAFCFMWFYFIENAKNLVDERKADYIRESELL